MKYGLIVFKETENIGDDIQSYSNLKFLPRVDYFIERERLNEFIPNKNEKVATIISGWYLHDVYSFPPSPYILPLITSIHFTDHWENNIPDYLSGLFLDYLKKYTPIGCRDTMTYNFMSKLNVDKYMSYCLTLTNKAFMDVKKEDYIAAVDVSDKVIDKIKILGKEVKIYTHTVDKQKNSKLSWKKRMTNVETLLREYQKASLVITTRLHCALPCLAMGVPVILIYNDKNNDVKNRMGDYIQYLTHMSEEEFIKTSKTTILKTKNSSLFLDSAMKLEDVVHKFINESSKESGTIDVEPDIYEKYFVVQKRFLMEMRKIDTLRKINKANRDNLIQNEHLMKKLEELNKELVNNEKKNKMLETELEDIKVKYYSEVNSRGYKVVSSLRNVKKRITGEKKNQ